jgi:hypothetical protein
LRGLDAQVAPYKDEAGFEQIAVALWVEIPVKRRVPKNGE